MNRAYKDNTPRWVQYFVNICLTPHEPLSIVHFVTERCNARCGHCFVDFSRCCPQEQELDLAHIRQLTKTIGSNLYNVNLTGGEPFLRNDLFEIAAAYLQNAGVRSLIITTNGTQTEALRSFLEKWKTAALPGRIKISISIDHREKLHDANRRMPGAFRKALESYHLIEAQGDTRLMADIALTVMPGNADAIQEVYQELKSRGITQISAILLREAGAMKKLQDKKAVMEAYGELVSQIDRDQRALRAPAHHRFWERLRRAKNLMVRDILAAPSRRARSRKECSSGSLFGVIAANGDVFPCEVLGRKHCIGSLRDSGMDFMALWRNGQKDVLHDVQSCKACTYECAWTVTIMTTPASFPRMCRYLWRTA